MEKVQRFNGKRGWELIKSDEPVPEQGWAVRYLSREVFRDGELVGTLKRFQTGSLSVRGFQELWWEPLNES